MVYKLLSCSCTRTTAKPRDASVGESFFWEPTGVEKTENWKYVGSGRGQYDVIEKYQYVGDGSGSFVPNSSGGRSCGGMCACFLGILLFLGAAAGAGYSMVKLTGGDAPNLTPYVETLDKAVASAAETLHLRSGSTHKEESRAPAKMPESITEGPLYNCTAPKETKSWSITKQAWCCKHKSIACPLFNCAIGELSMWPAEKVQWCCENESRGCTSKKEEE